MCSCRVAFLWQPHRFKAVSNLLDLSDLCFGMVTLIPARALFPEAVLKMSLIRFEIKTQKTWINIFFSFFKNVDREIDRRIDG